MGRDFGRLLSPLVRLAVEALSALFAAVFGRSPQPPADPPLESRGVWHCRVAAAVPLDVDSLVGGAEPRSNSYQKHKGELFALQGGVCTGCGSISLFEGNLTVDHITPVDSGGPNHIGNLQLLCHSCNSTKGIGTQEKLWAKREKRGIETAPLKESWAKLQKRRVERIEREFCQLGTRWQEIFGEGLPYAIVGTADRQIIEKCIYQKSERLFHEEIARTYEEPATETVTPRSGREREGLVE